MNFESIQRNPEIPKTLEQLTPAEGSLPWLKRQNRKEEAIQLEQQTTQAIQKLSRYKDINFAKKDAENYLKLAAKTGSALLLQWTEFNIYYPNLQIPNDAILISTAKIELARNLAVMTYDEAKDLQNQGKSEEADRKLKQAENLFTWYIQRIIPVKPVTIPIEKIQEKLNTEIVEIFFPDNVKTATDDLINTESAMFDEGFDIKGIDSGLIRVYVACAANLPKNNFPQVYDEYYKFKQHIADKHHVSVEEIDRLLDWETNEIFGNQNAKK